MQEVSRRGPVHNEGPAWGSRVSPEEERLGRTPEDTGSDR